MGLIERTNMLITLILIIAVSVIFEFSPGETPQDRFTSDSKPITNTNSNFPALGESTPPSSLRATLFFNTNEVGGAE